MTTEQRKCEPCTKEEFLRIVSKFRSSAEFWAIAEEMNFVPYLYMKMVKRLFADKATLTERDLLHKMAKKVLEKKTNFDAIYAWHLDTQFMVHKNYK